MEFENMVVLTFQKLPRPLTMTADEAMAPNRVGGLLAEDARVYADRVTQALDDEYDTPEDLTRAVAIQEATWRRNFKQRWELRQAEALRAVAEGMDPQAAIYRVVTRAGIAEPPPTIQKILENIQ
jgi:hypothetical protein